MSFGVPNEGARVSSTPSITPRKKTQNSKRVNPLGKKRLNMDMGIGRHVVMERKHVNLMLLPGQLAMSMLDAHPRKDFNIHGMVFSKKKHAIWNVRFDILPVEDQIVNILRKHVKHVLFPGKTSQSMIVRNNVRWMFLRNFPAGQRRSVSICTRQ